MTSIHDKAEKNDVNGMRQLLASNPGAVNEQDEDGQSPLHVAARNNRKEIAEVLLVAGAKVDLQDLDNKTPLMIAKENGHNEMMIFLENYKKTVDTIPLLPTTSSALDNPTRDELDVDDADKSLVSITDNTSINIMKKFQTTHPLKTTKWNRSKTVIVGEGRAGKTALANSIIGKPFATTESTVGINNLSFSINYADVRNGKWNLYENPEKELETAKAMSIREQQKNITDENPERDNNASDSNYVDSIINRISGIFSFIGLQKKPNLLVDDTQPSPAMNTAHIAPVKEAQKSGKIGDDFVAKSLAENIQFSSDLSISLFDFGGQPVFDVIHHLFLTPYGIYIVVFNMMWLAEGATETDRANCWARLEAWVNSIIMHTSEASDNSSSKGSAVPKSAPIVFVGTCKDKIIENAKDVDGFFRDISKELSFIIDITRSPVIRNIVEDLWFFPVDNVMGRGDSSLIAMLQSIEEVMKKSEYVTQEKPLIWLQALDKMKARKDIISYSMTEVRDIFASCGIEESGYSEVLAFFNKLGELLWIDEDGLRDTIIIDAITYFVNPVTRFICINVESQERGETYFHEDNVQTECKNDYPNEWDSMVATGVVRGYLLQALLGANHVVIVNLMVKFGLIVAVLSVEETQTIGVTPNDKKYIVPLLLHTETSPDQYSPLTSLTSLESQSSFFFSFSLPSKSPTWSEPLTDSQLISEGYLPHGLYLRYLGKLLTWSQLITPGYDALSEIIYNNDVTIRFGVQSFRIRVFDNYNTVCVTIEKSRNYAALLLRLKGIMEEVIKECFQFRSKAVTEFLPAISSHYFIPIDLVKQTCTQKQSLILSDNIRIDREMLKERYSKWWELHDTSEDCDVFLSYRRGEHDSRFVSLIYDALLNYDYSYVFHDDHVMEFSDNLHYTFSKALLTAKVFVPFCSHDALIMMKDHNPEVVDYVLLEWILALECWKRGSLEILPILYGSIDESKEFLNLDYRGVSLLPDIIPSRTIDTVVSILNSNQMMPSPELRTVTVRSVVTNIVGFYSFRASQHNRLKECISSCTRHIQEVYLYSNTYPHMTVSAAATKKTMSKNTVNTTVVGSVTNEKVVSIDVEKAWSILTDPSLVVGQDDNAKLSDFLADFGVYKSTDLIGCKDVHIRAIANKLKEIPKKEFLQALWNSPQILPQPPLKVGVPMTIPTKNNTIDAATSTPLPVIPTTARESEDLDDTINNNKDMAELLLSAEANQDIKTPLMIAKENRDNEMVILLENYKKTVDTTIPLLPTSSSALDNPKTDELDIDDVDKSLVSITAHQLKTTKWNRSKIMIAGEEPAGRTALATSIMGNPFATTDPTIIRPLNFHEVVQRFCKGADDLCAPYISDGIVSTWPITMFSLPIQTGINTVSELSALSAEKANRVTLAERGVSRALCCLLIDATCRLMLSEKDRNSLPSEDQHQLLDIDQQETETRKYIQSILILIFGYLSDEISLNAYSFVTLFERSMDNILKVLSYPYVIKCLQFLCKYRNEMVRVPALDVVVGLLRCKHTLATEQMDGVADIMNELLQQKLIKHSELLGDDVTQKICEALARICRSSRYFAISFLKKKYLFKIMLLEARSQCLEIRYQALCCLSAMCTVVSNCTFRGIATFLLTLAADSTDGQLSYFPWKEGTASSTFTTSDIVHNELYLLANIRKWADNFVESLEIFSKALKEDNEDIKVVALKGLSYLTADKQMSLHLVKNGYLENIIEIGTDPDCPVEVTAGIVLVLSNLGFDNGDKDIGKEQNSWEVISSWFNLRRGLRTHELARETAVQIMNSEYMEDKDFKILALERFAASLDRLLSYSVLDDENTRMCEESSSLLKLLQDSIIDALQKIYSKGLFSETAYILEDAVTYFMEEIKESFVKLGTYTDASEVFNADRFSPPVLVAVERRASAAIHHVGSFPSNLSETVEVEGGSQALTEVTDIHSEEDESDWLKSQYPSLLQRSLISVRLALDAAHDNSESIQSLNYRCFDGSLEVMNTFPKWVISLPPGDYLTFNGMGRAMELLIDECHSSHSSDDNVKWALTFRDSTFGGDFFNDLLDTLTELPEICSINFVCQEPRRSEQEGDEKGHSQLGQLVCKLPRTISLVAFQSVLTIYDIENLCDLLVSGDSSFCLQSLAIVGHKLEEGEAKQFLNSLIQLLDSQNIVAPRSQGFGAATAISANVETLTIRKAALYYLDVSNNQLDAAACGDILRAACGGTLRGLELSENNISVASDFIMALDTALLSPACQLCHLGLSSTALTSEVVCEILSYLRANLTLLSVDFSGNNIESSLEFNLQLETVIRVNKTLKKINFAKNNLNSQKFGGQNTLTSIMNGLTTNHIIHFVCLENNSLTFKQGDNSVYQRIIEKLKQNRMKSVNGALSVAKNKTDNTVPASDLEKPERNLFYVFFAEPLVRLGNNGMLKAYSKVEYQDEIEVISQVFNNARQAISVRYNFATKPLLSETKMDGFRALHFSGNGNVEGLHFENGRGCLDIIDHESILQLSSELQGPWDFIFLAFSKSQRVGQGFISTGVRHVICIDTNSELFAIVSNTFCGALYSALARGDTVQQAFDKGKEAVRNSPRDRRYPLVTDTTVEAEKFRLLPEGGSHNVPIFLERMNILGSLQYIPYDIPKLDHLPKLRPHFIGREIDTHTAINDILANRVVQLQGQPGIGKTSVAVAAGRYMAERRMLKGGVIFVGLAKVRTFWGFLYALGEALYLGSLEVRKILTFLINKRNEFSSKAFNDKKEHPQPNANQSYYQGLLVESGICDRFPDFSCEEFQALCDGCLFSVDLLTLLLLTSLSSVNILIILDHTNSITKSTATEKHEDCAAFLNFVDRLLERCREVRVLLTTSCRQRIRQEGSGGSYGECMELLQRLNLRMSLQLYCQLSKYFPSKQHQTDFINRFIHDDNQPMDERMAERLHQFLVAVFLLTGEGNPAKIRRRVSTNDDQTYRDLCKLLKQKSDNL